MIELNWETASEQDAEKLLARDSSLLAMSIRQADMLAHDVLKDSSQNKKCAPIYDAFKRRLAEGNAPGRLLVSLEMRDWFQGKKNEMASAAPNGAARRSSTLRFG